MRSNKKLLLIGKSLIVLGVLWPAIMCIDTYTGSAWWLDVYYWATSIYADIYLSLHPDGVVTTRSYDFAWQQNINYWVFAILLIVGFSLCLISRYKGKFRNDYTDIKLSDSIVGLVFKIFRWVFYGILGFWGVILSLHLFHFLVLTPNIKYTVWGITCIGGLLGVFALGSAYSNKYSKLRYKETGSKTAQVKYKLEREERKKKRKNINVDDINYEIDMNKSRREELLEVVEHLEEAIQRLEEIRDDEQDAFDSLPDSLQESVRGQAMLDAIDVMDDFEAAISKISQKIEWYAKPKKKKE